MSLLASAVTLLTGFAVTAVAVGPRLAAEASIAQRLVVEAVVPEGLDAQLAELAAQPLNLTRSEVTRATDTAESLLTRLGVRDPGAVVFIRTDPEARALLAGRAGKMVQAHTDSQGRLLDLVVRFPSDRTDLARTHFTRLLINRSDAALRAGTTDRAEGRWQARTSFVPFTSQMRLSSGTIRSTLFAATDESGLPDAVAAQLAEIFATDIDFHRELRRGDTFSVVYESLLADGEPVSWNEGAGRVLAAEFVNGGKAHRAVWFAAADGRGSYYDVDGRSKRRAFLASPLEFSRVTSGFAMRMHPLLQTWRAHLGVDYAAPTGTVVRSIGEGTVEFAGRQNGYGNVVQVRHANDRTSLYAHLSRIEAKVGQHIEQGQRLGAVGMTGWATGPHLHFEFRVGGRHQDPLTLGRAADAMPLAAESRLQFAQTVASLRQRLEVAETLTGRQGGTE